MDAFGPNLVSLMKARGIDVGTLADRVGVPYNAVVRWRSSIAGPKFQDAVKIARALDMNLDEFARVTAPDDRAPKRRKAPRRPRTDDAA